MNRAIWIDVKEAKAVLSEKSRLDAFCLALKIKFMFRSSSLIFTTYTETAKNLGMGKTKLKKLLECAIAYGYIRKDEYSGGKVRYVATKMHCDKEYAYKVEENSLPGLSFPNLKNLLRKIVLENHISTIESVSDTHCRVTNPSTADDLRRAKKRESRMLRRDFNEKYVRLSYYRIAKLLNVSRRKACQIVKEMRYSGDICRILHCTEINCDPKACRCSFSYVDGKGSVIVISQATRTGKMVCANSYKCEKRHVGHSNNESRMKK